MFAIKGNCYVWSLSGEQMKIQLYFIPRQRLNRMKDMHWNVSLALIHGKKWICHLLNLIIHSLNMHHHPLIHHSADASNSIHQLTQLPIIHHIPSIYPLCHLMVCLSTHHSLYSCILSPITQPTNPSIWLPTFPSIIHLFHHAFVCLSASVHSLLATTSADQTVKIWQTADFSLKTTLKDATQRWVWDCAFSEDSQYLVTGKLFKVRSWSWRDSRGCINFLPYLHGAVKQSFEEWWQ